MGDPSLGGCLRMRKVAVDRRKESDEVAKQAPDDIPKASESSLLFLRSLGGTDFKDMEFCDRLTTYSDSGKEIGNFSVSIVPSSNGFRDGFLVKASSVGKIDGMLCGSKVIAHISQRMLETVQHRQHDFLYLRDECLKRDTEIIKKPGGFLISRTTSRGTDVKKDSRFVEQSRVIGLISEAADLLLQRILVRKDLPNDFRVLSLDMSGNFGSTKYETLTEDLRLKSEELFGLSRTIFSWQDQPLTWHSHLTNKGQLVYRHRLDSSFTMTLPADDRVENRETGFVDPLTSSESEEMHSLNFIEPNKPLNGKTNVFVDSRAYVQQHPELNTITTDFLQLLFVQKPTNVPLFAAQYFATLTAEPTDSTETTAVRTT